MNLNSFFTPALLFAVSMFCRCFPLNFSRSLQPPPQPQVPVAYQASVRKTHNVVRPTSKMELITKLRQQIQTHTSKEKLDLITLENYRARYLAQKSSDNLYTYFLNSKRVEVSEIAPSLEKHHIQPRFEGGGDEPENLILLTPEDHMLAHFLRYLEYGKKQDASVVLFRCGYCEEARRIGQESALEKMKEDKKGRWDPTAQSEREKKGGPKGGSANTEAQFKARQSVGKKHGQQTGFSNQSKTLQEILQQKLEWVHNTRPDQKFVTNPSKSAKDIIEQLEKYVPNQIKNQTTFYKVFHGERTGMYGWTLVDKGIRSEAEGGKGPSERSETST